MTVCSFFFAFGIKEGIKEDLITGKGGHALEGGV